jgi:hypothetical protein
MAVWTSNESTTAVVDDAAIRPFTVEVPHEEIDELQRRVRATRWPDKETVDDRSQGVQTGEAAPLVEYRGGPATTGAGSRQGSTRCRSS